MQVLYMNTCPQPLRTGVYLCIFQNHYFRYIYRNNKSKSPQIREMAYQSLVRPQLEYSAAVWDPHVKEQINKIEMVKIRAARWTLNDYAGSSSVTLMLNQLNWQTLEERRSVARRCLFYKIVNDLVAVPIPDYLLDLQILPLHDFLSNIYRQGLL